MAIRIRGGFLAGRASKFKDSIALRFGDGTDHNNADVGDVAFDFNGTKMRTLPTTDDTEWEVGNGTLNMDLQWFGASATDDLVLDASANTLKLDGIDLTLEDSDILAFGDANDITATWNVTKLVIDQATTNSAIDVGVDGAGIDLVLYGDTASAKVQWDQSADDLLISGVANIRHSVDGVNRALMCSTATLAYTDTAAKNLFQIPANADVLGIIVNVTTAFNSSGTDLVDIGKTGTANHFINDLDVSTTGQTLTGFSNLGDVGGSAVQIEATFIQSVADASAGAATITFLWAVD